MYDTSPYSSSYSTSSEGLGLFFGMIFFVFIISILIYVVTATFLGKIFNKAGVESWKAWVPILNSWKILEIGGQQGFWSILSLFPFVNMVSFVFLIIAMHNINKKMGYDVGMTFMAVLLPIVWIIILATSKNQWNDSLGAPRVDQPDMAMPYPVGNQPYPPQGGPANGQPQYAPYGPPPAAQNQQPQQHSGFQQTAPQPVFTQAPAAPQPHQSVQQPVPPVQYQPYQSPQPQLTEQQPVAQAYPAPETVVDEVKSAEEPITNQPVGESVDQQPTDESADQQSTETKPPTY